MSARPWYKRYPSDFIAGTIHMSLEQKGAYSIVLDLLYDRGGPIPDDARWIARVCGCSTRKWKQIRETLIDMGKLVADDGWIDNPRASLQRLNEEKEHEKLSNNARKAHENKAESNKNNSLDEKGLQHTRSQKPDKKEDPPISPPTTEPDELALAVEAWNELAEQESLARCQVLNDGRRRRLAQRLRECGGLEGWRAALANIRGSPFLLGDNDRGWRADFDFVLQAKSFTKLMEGGYAQSTPAPRANQRGKARGITPAEQARPFAARAVAAMDAGRPEGPGRAGGHDFGDGERGAGGFGTENPPMHRDGSEPVVDIAHFRRADVCG